LDDQSFAIYLLRSSGCCAVERRNGFTSIGIAYWLIKHWLVFEFGLFLGLIFAFLSAHRGSCFDGANCWQ
jgi:hypothetical protein